MKLIASDGHAKPSSTRLARYIICPDVFLGLLQGGQPILVGKNPVPPDAVVIRSQVNSRGDIELIVASDHFDQVNGREIPEAPTVWFLRDDQGSFVR